MKAVIYARVSGDDTKTATSSVDAQLEAGRKYAAERGYDVVGEYFERPDKQTSGADWLPEIDKVMKLAKTGTYDVLVVHKVDRLARNRFKQMSIENNLEYMGIKVEYVNGQYADSPEGRLLKGMVAEFAEYEREVIKERTKRGICRAVSVGNVTVGGSNAPFGYDAVKIDSRRQLIINKSEAAVVREIFRLYVLEGFTIHQLKQWLDKNTIERPGKGTNHTGKNRKTRQGNTNLGWSLGTINNLLNNETYVGRWYYRKTKRIKIGEGKYRNIKRPKDEWLLVEVPSIIDEEIFCQVQARRANNKRLKGRQKKNFYILGGMMKCGHCGLHVSGVTKKGEKRGSWQYYICTAHHMPGRFGYKCDLPQIGVRHVDSAVWKWVKGLILDPAKLRASLDGYRNQQENDNSPLVEMLHANQHKLEILEEEKDRLIKAYSAGVLTLDEIAEQKTDLDKQITTLLTAVSRLENDLSEKIMTEEEAQSIEALAAIYREEVDFTETDPKAQRGIFKRLDVAVSLLVEDGQFWADASCKIGEDKLPVGSNTTPYTEQHCILRARLPIGEGHKFSGKPLRTPALSVYQRPLHI